MSKFSSNQQLGHKPNSVHKINVLEYYLRNELTKSVGGY